MCGITGFVGPTGPTSPDRRALLEAMVAAIGHRGPDGRGYYLDDDAALGMTRLAIIDLAHGDQPKSASGGDLRVVMNGEIYNHRSLRRELEALGHRFESDSDTEVAARAIEEWGTDAFTRLDGMFAIAAWQRRTRRLLLARDRFGEKPLYYWQLGPAVAFASEPKCFARFAPLPDLDEASLIEYLHLGYIPAPRSAWPGIHKLAPAHFAVVEDGRVESARYWSLDWQETAAPADAVAELDRRLAAAVESRLVSDVQVGVLLSGGIDSSLIAFHAAAAQPGLPTFTVGFDDPAKDESPHARRVAEIVGSTHHEITVTASEAIAVVDDLSEIYDEPFADPSAIPTVLISRFTAQHVKVVLSGDGGDELFSGYRRYAQIRAIERIGSVTPRLARRLAARLWWSSPSPLHRAFAAISRPGSGWAATYRNHSAFTSQQVLDRVLVAEPGLGRITAWYEALAVDGPRAAQLVDAAVYLPDDLLVKSDRASMSTGLEVRAPFLDPALAIWAFSLPRRISGRPGAKALPRALLGRHLPPDLAERPKQGFAVPLGSWLRGALRPLLDDCLADNALRARGLINADGPSRLVRMLDAGRDDVALTLWQLLVLELWQRRWAGAGRSTGSRATS